MVMSGMGDVKEYDGSFSSIEEEERVQHILLSCTKTLSGGECEVWVGHKYEPNAVGAILCSLK